MAAIESPFCTIFNFPKSVSQTEFSSFPPRAILFLMGAISSGTRYSLIRSESTQSPLQILSTPSPIHSPTSAPPKTGTEYPPPETERIKTRSFPFIKTKSSCLKDTKTSTVVESSKEKVAKYIGLSPFLFTAVAHPSISKTAVKTTANSMFILAVKRTK